MQRTSTQPILDEHGAVMFRCRVCHAALTDDDFFNLGLRLPEHGESREDYCDAELLEDVSHMECVGKSAT